MIALYEVDLSLFFYVLFCFNGARVICFCSFEDVKRLNVVFSLDNKFFALILLEEEFWFMKTRRTRIPLFSLEFARLFSIMCCEFLLTYFNCLDLLLLVCFVELDCGWMEGITEFF